MGGGLLAAGVADALFLVLSVRGSYVEGHPIDLLWAIAVCLLALAAARDEEARAIPLAGRRLLALPAVFASLALGLLAVDQVVALDPVTVGLAALTLAVVIARMALTFGEQLALLERTRRESVTDALTGLGNRRRLVEDLDRATAQARAGTERTLALFDLDGFKLYNDTFGHPAGDALLARLGRRLTAAVEGEGFAYRARSSSPTFASTSATSRASPPPFPPGSGSRPRRPST